MSDSYKDIPDVPDNYFNQFRSDMKQTVKDLDLFDIKEDAPLLRSIDKSAGFRIPDHYFTELRLSEVIKKSRSRVFTLQEITSIAASLLMVFSIAYFLLNNPDHEDVVKVDLNYLTEVNLEEDLLLENLSEEDLQFFEQSLNDTEVGALIESNIENFDLTDLEELL